MIYMQVVKTAIILSRNLKSLAIKVVVEKGTTLIISTTKIKFQKVRKVCVTRFREKPSARAGL